MRKAWLGVVLLGASWAWGQSLTFGVLVQPSYFSPTLEGSLPIEGFTLGARVQRGAVGLSLDGALELGPVGRVGFGLRGGLSFAGWGAGLGVRSALGPLALDVGVAYTQAASWVLDNDTAGWSGRLAGRYRLGSRETLGLLVAYAQEQISGEASLALRSQSTLTVGAGYRGGLYGLVAWRGELDEAGTLLDASLRAGLFNQLEANLYTTLFEADLKLGLTLAYPWAGKLNVEMNPVRLDFSLSPERWSVWARYQIDLGGP